MEESSAEHHPGSSVFLGFGLTIIHKQKSKGGEAISHIYTSTGMFFMLASIYLLKQCAYIHGEEPGYEAIHTL